MMITDFVGFILLFVRQKQNVNFFLVQIITIYSFQNYVAKISAE